ncbi:hypothetical protein N0V93_000259 [Gnomoniopsis smithogilvyi]|uniref:Major facilitator superfamily (MFS) profile domain-containing protein n=1 Tax=Gnomoniopsis smithogilvyi TaxID=1191159 RepID=A0A9W8Z1G3_9PEZI|nr:hypothetical protein N0V93_000259 [Gnomoniopsis smithogilvyi]
MVGNTQFNVGDTPGSEGSFTNGSNGYTPSLGSTMDAASEDTPLLGSRSSSSTLNDCPPRANNDHDDDEAQHYVTPTRAICICFSMWLLMFMQACNMSGITMIQGYIADDLDAHDKAIWFTSVFLIVVGCTSPLSGRLATIFSLRHMVLASALLFAAGAVICSRATSFVAFILGRAITGMGGGCIMTLSLILVLQLTSRKRRGLFIGMVNAGFTLGVSAGAVIFGALLPVLGWRELFLVQAPLGIVAGFGVYFSIPEFAKTEPLKDKSTFQKLKAIDYAGATTLTASTVLFLYGLSGTIQPTAMLLSLLILAIFVFNEYKLTSDPLIPISILQSRGVLLSCLAQLGLMSARWTVLFYAPIFILAVRGLPPTVAGAVLIPTNVGFACGGIIVGWVHVRRAGAFWLPCIVSVLLFGLALFGLSLTSNATSPAWLYLVIVFCNGFSTGAALNYTLAHILHMSMPGTHFVATGLLATFRGFAGSFGTSIGGGIFTRKLKEELAAGFEKLDGSSNLSPGRVNLITRLVGSPNLVYSGTLSHAERAVAVDGYEVALKTLYTSACALTVLVLFFQAGTGWTAPASQETEEEIAEEIAEHDGRGEV